MNYRIKNAFTLSELLLALLIVGVIATMTIPALVNNVMDKVYANQVKNMVANIEQLAQDELVSKRTRDLSNTDFAKASDLLTDKHFSISKTCSASDATKKCWKSGNKTATDNTVKYRTINNTSTEKGISSPGMTLILTNGVTLGYTTPVKNANDKDVDGVIGYFLIDVNGSDGPNIYGRDVFGMYVTNSGRIADKEVLGSDKTLAEKISSCKGGDAGWCFGALRDNNWKMSY